MNFSDDLADLDLSVEEHLCDDAAYQQQGDGPLIPARVMIDRPMDIERFQAGGFSRARPVLAVSASVFPSLRSGDVFTMGRWADGAFTPGTEIWRMAEAPARPDDGRWWKGEVEPL